MKFKRDDRAFSVALYAFLVIAATILAVMFFIHLPDFWRGFLTFINSLWSVIIGFAIAYVCNPLVHFAESVILPRLKRHSRRFARILSIALTFIIVALVITILVFMIVPQIALNFNAISSRAVYYVNAIIDSMDAWITGTGWFPQFEGLRSLLQLGDVSATLNAWLAGIAGALSRLGLQIVEAISNVVIGAFLALHFLYHKEYIAATFKKVVLALFPARVFRAVADVLRHADRAFGQFIVGKLFDSIIVGLLCFIVFALVGMPYYPLISAIICITSIIPAFGYIIGAIPCFIIVWFENPTMSLWFVVILLVIQQLDGNIIGPKIVGSATGLASVWVLTAIMLMGAYFGPIGWFIGVPLFAVLYRVVGDMTNRKLAKKSLPLSLAHYEETLLREIYVDVFNTSQNREEAQDEAVDQ